MELQDNSIRDTEDKAEQQDNKARAYRVEDDDNLTEKDLRRGWPVTDEDMKNPDDPGMEGKGMGGDKFGENNLTPSGDDKDNPSQMAGYTNAYFGRTQPAEEHPENSNFTDPNQAGQSNYDQVKDATSQTGQSDHQPEGDNKDDGEQKKPNPQQPYREGTADDDGKNDADKNNKQQVNIPGPNELPDQQKVGE